MDRRAVIKSLSILLGGSMVGANNLLSGCANFRDTTQFFSKKDIDFINDIGAIVIPTTEDSGSAKDADVGNFVNVIVRDCYTKEEQEIMQKGIEQLKNIFPENIQTIDANTQYQRMVKIDEAAKAHSQKNTTPHYFTLLKQLIIVGYFTSEVGSHAQRYVPVPGYFDGNMPYRKGDKNFGPV